jgi:peptidyl-tRNA hydrolase
MKRAAAKIPKQLRQWENYGQPKIALKVKSHVTTCAVINISVNGSDKG